jgi:uncharacterized MnhB-related membrane protein
MFWVCLIFTVFDSSDRHHTASIPLVSLTDAVSIRNHTPPIRLTHMRRGEWNSDHGPWFNIMTIQVWVKSLILVRGDHWLSVSGNYLYYIINAPNVVISAMLGGKLQNLSDIDDWKMLQVIMIARLHAMYQGSRTMLIFLVIIFLAVNISCGVLTAIVLKNAVVGKFCLLTYETQLIDKHQRSWYSLACICAVMAMRGIPCFLSQWFGCSTLFGRSSRCVFRSGSLWNTSVTCDALGHRQDRRSETVSECWYNLTCFILRSELVIENVVIFSWNSARTSFAGVSCFELIGQSPAFWVRWPVADICLYQRLIISVELKFYWSFDTWKRSSAFIGRADVRVGTTPHP